MEPSTFFSTNNVIDFFVFRL